MFCGAPADAVPESPGHAPRTSPMPCGWIAAIRAASSAAQAQIHQRVSIPASRRLALLSFRPGSAPLATSARDWKKPTLADITSGKWRRTSTKAHRRAVGLDFIAAQRRRAGAY